ncbi:restriction endonuclease subunit S [Streptomyces decoyicus]|uniref:restriction endonuclease subunit S n=1 Tax=Streptomyces decoyicus TaxID=249567 RepID=UPI0033A6CA67
MAIVPSDLDGATASTGFTVLRATEELDPAYLFHWVRSPSFVSEMVSQATGQSYPAVSDRIVKGAFIPAPSRSEQLRISRLLDYVEALRAQRRESLSLLEDLAQSIFLDMFGDPSQVQPNFPLQPLVDTLGAPLQNGAYYPKDLYVASGGVEMVHMGDAFYGKVERGDLKRVACPELDREKYGLNSSDVLVARRSLNYEGSAKPCLIPETREPLIFESSLIRVTPNPEIVTPAYLYHYLSNHRVRERFVFPFVTGATISGISQKNLAKIPIMTPPVELQREFAARLESVNKLKASHESHLAGIDALFDSLQHRAFRGELQLDTSARTRTQDT